jgi:hypothetical protein
MVSEEVRSTVSKPVQSGVEGGESGFCQTDTAGLVANYRECGLAALRRGGGKSSNPCSRKCGSNAKAVRKPRCLIT